METKVVAEEKTEKAVTVDRLAKLGFKSAVQNAGLTAKMKIAYDKYLYVSQEKINAFNEKLKKDTMRENSKSHAYKRLKFVPIEQYPVAPPESVLEALEKAKADNCFDMFEIAKVEWHIKQKDPILFGHIVGCTDRFFISQWDDDIKFEDIYMG